MTSEERLADLLNRLTCLAWEMRLNAARQEGAAEALKEYDETDNHEVAAETWKFAASMVDRLRAATEIAAG